MALSIDNQRLNEILGGATSIVTIGTTTELNRLGNCIFPGAFNPRHLGHREMAAYASRRFGSSVTFEISIENVDKPNLTADQIQARLSQFEECETVSLTRAARFTAKAELFPQARFVVGADTMIRIGDPKYYGNDPNARNRAIDLLLDRAVRFLVFGRVVDGTYEPAEKLPIPNRLRKLCDAVPEHDYRRDISSTELRR